MARHLRSTGISVNSYIHIGPIIDATKIRVKASDLDLVVTTTFGESGKPHWLSGGISHKLVEFLDIPVLLVPVTNTEHTPKLDRIQVALDGSDYSERVLPYACLLAKSFHSELLLMCVPAVPEVKDYRAAAEVVAKIRQKAEMNMRKFLTSIARSLRKDNLDARILVTGSIPGHTIIDVAGNNNTDMVMMTSQGRGGYNAMLLGSVLEYVVQNTEVPVFIVPIQETLPITDKLRAGDAGD
jgi:nucleotide-binding universal stress UspA family protein